MKIVITGNNGFIGKVLHDALISTHDVIGVNRKYGKFKTDLSLNKIDFDGEENLEVDTVVCCTGLAHTQTATLEEYKLANVDTVENTLKSFGQFLPQNVIFLSSLNVYGRADGCGISESYPLLGGTNFAKTKIQAEEFVADWCKSHHVNYCILRLPLVVAPNPPGNLGQMINAITKGFFFYLNKGRAKRSMILASDLIQIIEKEQIPSGIYNLTDGYHPSFSELGDLIADHLGTRKPFSMPKFLAEVMAKIGDIFQFFPLNTHKMTVMSRDNTYNDDLARKQLDWNSKNVLQNIHYLFQNDKNI